MIRYFIISCFVFSIAFYFIPVSSIPLAPVLEYAYQYNLESRVASIPHSELVKAGQPVFFGVKNPLPGQNWTVRGPQINPDIKWEEDALIVVPFLGKGIFAYKKIGKQIQYYAPTGELLWFKEYYSYPVSDATGENLFLLTGDSNRLDIIDQNGETPPINAISGNFMIDYAFDHKAQNKIVAFSDGRVVYIHNNKLKGVLSMDANDQLLYVKSSALSSDGSLMALHFLQDDKDILRVYSVEITSKDNKTDIVFGQVDEFELPEIYPHLLHMAVNRGGLLVLTPDKTLFFGMDGSDDWARRLPSGKDIYRPVFAGKDFFVYGEYNKIHVLSQQGLMMYSFLIHSTSDLWRILPTKSARSFAVQTREFVEMWLLNDQV